MTIKPVIPGETLVPFQKDAVRFLNKNKKVLLDGAIGSGKTVMCAVASNVQHLKNPYTQTLVLCPAIMKGTWVRELQKWSKPIVKGFKLCDLETGRSTIPKGSTHVVVSHSLSHKEEIIKQLVHWFRSGTGDGNIIVIIDESHRLRSPEAKTTQRVHRYLLPYAQHIYMASGTPLVRGPCDIYTTKCAIEDLEVSEAEYIKYGSRYMYYYVDRYSGIKFKGIKTQYIQEFKDWMALNSFKITRLQVEKELPPLVIREVFLKLKPLNRKKPPPMATDRVITALRKLPSVIEYIDDVLDGRDIKTDPLLIFGYTVDAMKEIHQHLLKKKYKVTFVTGETSNKDKAKAQHDFQSGLTDIYLGGISSAGIGVTLTRANEMILTELHWNSVDVDQVIGRIHRISQKRSTIATCLVAEGTVEEGILRTMKEKARTIQRST